VCVYKCNKNINLRHCWAWTIIHSFIHSVSQSVSQSVTHLSIHWFCILHQTMNVHTSSSAMAERPRNACVESVILMGWVILTLNFRLKRYVSRYWPLDGRIVILQLFLWKFSHKKLCSRLYSIEIELYFKKQKSLFEPPFRGNVRRTHSIYSSLESPRSTSYSSQWNFFSLSRTVETL